MSLGLAVMVRDDAQRLDRCLQSIKNSVDELFVLDTGSKDDTVEVARSHQANVTEIKWPGSFSIGLNVLLDRVTTDWVLRLDSDEWFEDSPGEALREATGSDAGYAYRLIRRDLYAGGKYEDIALLRLWRHDPSLRFEGAVHENIPSKSFAETWPGMVEQLLPLTFMHDGYLHGGHLDKLRRNVGLLEQEVATRPTEMYFRVLLAKGYRDLGDPRWQPAMVEIAQEALSTPIPPIRLLVVVLADLLGAMSIQELKGPLADTLIAYSVKWFSNSPVMVHAVAQAELERGSRERALAGLQRLASLAVSGDFDRTLPVGEELIGKPMWRKLDRLADQLGRSDICAKCEPFL